jgi:hypothetical protein
MDTYVCEKCKFTVFIESPSCYKVSTKKEQMAPGKLVKGFCNSCKKPTGSERMMMMIGD